MKQELDKELDLMTMKQFVESLKSGFITDEDGFGYYSDGEYMYEIVDYKTLHLNLEYKYVAWVNC